MKPTTRKVILALLAVVALLPFLAYWLVDAWMESSGGRRMLEKELTRRAGMPVLLTGDFDLMLLPSIGVSGTGLVIGGAGPDSAFAQSREYEISVALEPLIEKKVLIEWIRLTGGEIHPERYPERGSSERADSSAKSFLPEVEELTIRDFQIKLPGDGEESLDISSLSIRNFAAGSDTPFTLVIENLASADGLLRWEHSRSRVYFGEMQFDLGGQPVAGEGCLLMQDPVSLHFDLRAGVFDLDAFRQELPKTNGGNGLDSAGGGLPFELRMRLRADELLSSGAVARGALISLGGDPDCG